MTIRWLYSWLTSNFSLKDEKKQRSNKRHVADKHAFKPIACSKKTRCHIDLEQYVTFSIDLVNSIGNVQ